MNKAVRRTNCFMLAICSLLVLLSMDSALAYTMSDVDSFMSSVQATLSNGDKIYKVQFQKEGQTGYDVMLDKNSPISKTFDSWKITSQGPCGYYWSNGVTGTAIFKTTYEDGSTKLEDSSVSATAARGTCTLFDNQIDTTGLHPGFAECPGIGSIAHSIYYISCEVGPPPDNYLHPPSQNFTPAPPTLLKEFFPIENLCSLSISSLTGTSKIINPISGGNLTIKGDITDSSGQPVTWTLTMPDGKTRTGAGTSVNETWDGKDASGKIVEPGSYSATLTAQTTDGQCSDNKTLPITVTEAEDGQCSLYVQFGSSAHMASGNLSHSQNLTYAVNSEHHVLSHAVCSCL